MVSVLNFNIFHSVKVVVAFEAFVEDSLSLECFLSIKLGNSLFNTANMQTQRKS